MHNWHYFYFRIAWPQSEGPRLWVPILILDRLVPAILDRHRADIPLWRVHGDRQPPVHRFRFCAHTTDPVADAIHAEIERGDLLAALRDHGLVEEYWRLREPNSGIEGSCAETDWSPELQAAWPHFMMGASGMLLELVTRLQGDEDRPQITADRERLQEFYGHLYGKVRAVWRTEGQHAFLHHLSALFSYEPLLVPMRF